MFLSLGHAHAFGEIIFILLASANDARSDLLWVKLVNELETTRI